jgi:hypothetical protein
VLPRRRCVPRWTHVAFVRRGGLSGTQLRQVPAAGASSRAAAPRVLSPRARSRLRHDVASHRRCLRGFYAVCRRKEFGVREVQNEAETAVSVDKTGPPRPFFVSLSLGRAPPSKRRGDWFRPGA